MKRIVLVIAVLLLGVGAFLLSDFLTQKNSKPEYAALFPKPLNLPEFNLTDGNDQPFNNNSLEGKWSLLFFGYTHCPDVCPTGLYMLANVLKNLKAKNIKLPQVAFISLDPQRDTVSKLKEYTAHFHKNIIGVTGEQSRINTLAKKMGIMHEKVYEKNGEYIVIENDNIPDEIRDSYTVNHSASIQIINPKGNLVGIFMSPHDANKISSDMARIQNNS